MSRIVVDTDVAPYTFNWHSLAQQYGDALRGSELILLPALALDEPLATNNRRDFEHVQKLRLLSLQRTLPLIGRLHTLRLLGKAFLMTVWPPISCAARRVGNCNDGRPTRNPLSTTATCQLEKTENWTEMDGRPT